jgi:hypothetical protein
MSQLIIEITSTQVESRTFKDTVRYSIPAYVHNGGAYPFPITIRLNAPNLAPPVGKYTLDLSAFRAGKYGDLEINSFDFSSFLRRYNPPLAGQK